MIAKREAQIRAFVPQPYFGLQARKDGLVLTWQDAGTGSHRDVYKRQEQTLVRDLIRARIPKKLEREKLFAD